MPSEKSPALSNQLDFSLSYLQHLKLPRQEAGALSWDLLQGKAESSAVFQGWWDG